MVSKQEDRIDFGKLEAEVLCAVEADAHYNRENNAKFRAVNQRVGTYEEFRDIVLASHIKPLEKDDLMNPKDFKQQWNICASKKDDGEGVSNKAETEKIGKKKLAKVPQNGHEFTKDWRRLCKTSTDKYNLLLELGGETLGKIFKTEISFGLLGEFIDALHSEFKEDHAEEILIILKHLCKTNRFELSVQFLSGKEKETCKKLFDKTQQMLEDFEDSKCKTYSQILAETMKSYGIQVSDS